MPSVAIVILNYNGRRHLEAYLPSVLTHSEGYRVIVADNSSTDNSLEYLRTQPVDLIQLDENYGYAGGYNQVLENLTEDLLVLLNSDVEVTAGWLDPIIAIMEADSSIGAAQPRILSWSVRDEFEYAGAAGGYIDWLGYPFCRGRIFNHLEKDLGQYSDTVDTFWSSGACLIIRNDCYRKSGGLDPDFFAHMEEIDLCWRINSLGMKTVCVGESVVYHLGGGTLHKSDPRKTYLNFRNGMYMLIKNLPAGRLWYTLIFRWILDWVAAIKFTLLDSPADGFAVIRAHFSIIANFTRMYRKREKTSYPSLIYGRSIVLRHFVGRLKEFPELHWIQ